jgi:hypothetical protein
MFLRVIIANHNALEEMISDRDKLFISRFQNIHGFAKNQAETIDKFLRLDG